MKQSLFFEKLPPDELVRRNAECAGRIASGSKNLASPSFSRLATADLELVFGVVDSVFLAGELGRQLARPGHRLDFRVAARMTHRGGTTTARRRAGNSGGDYAISIAPRVIHDTFQTVRQAVVCGLTCHDMRAALCCIMQHEMIHLAEFLAWNESSCSGTRFRSIVLARFGHTESQHRMLTPAERARTTHHLGPGDMVGFEFDGQMLVGKINRINRRATVLVSDAGGPRYSDGGRYRKYYVPLGNLRAWPGAVIPQGLGR